MKKKENNDENNVDRCKLKALSILIPKEKHNTVIIKMLVFIFTIFPFPYLKC